MAWTVGQLIKLLYRSKSHENLYVSSNRKRTLNMTRQTWYASWFDTILLIIVLVVISKGLSNTLNMPILIGTSYGLCCSWSENKKLQAEKHGLSLYVHRYHNMLPFPLTFLKSLSSATVPWTTKEISKVVICSNKNFQCLKRQKLWTLGSTTKKWQLNKNIKLHFKMHYATDTSIVFSVNQRR